MNILNTLITVIKSRLTRLIAKLRLYTSRGFIQARIIDKFRTFAGKLLNIKPKDKNDYYTLFGWMISKKLAHAALFVLGVVSIWYILSNISAFGYGKGQNTVRTYSYNSIILRFVNGHVRIKAHDGYIAYDGNVEDGSVSGNGILYYPNGNTAYSGVFSGNKYEGKGTAYYEDGAVWYVGSFHNNQFDGKGKEYRSSGTLEYDGNFMEGYRNGEGILYDASGDELYNGNFSYNSIVYSDLLGIPTSEAAKKYSGEREVYQSDEGICVVLDDIDAMYFASADPEALSDDLTTSEVYVLSDSFRAGKTSVRTIEEIKTLLGTPLYDGESTVIFPEAVLISRLKSEGKIYDEAKLTGTEQFTDVTTVTGYNRAAVVYLYSFEKDGLIYEFICGSAQGAFEFYRIRKA